MSDPTRSRTWQIYEWEDGSRICMIEIPGYRPKFMLNPGRRPSRMRDFAVFTPEPGPPVHLLLGMKKDIVNLHFLDSAEKLHEDEVSDYRLQEQKLAGFALDLGVSRNPFFRGLFETEDWGNPSIIRYPKFVPDERFERRVEEAMKMWGSTHWPETFEKTKRQHFLGCIHGMEMECRHSRRIQISWDADGSGVRRTISATRPIGRRWSGEPGTISDLEMVTKNLIDMVLEQEGLVLPESLRQQWEKENVLRGQFLIPSPEEVEVFRILEEPLPFFWKDEALVQWLSGKEQE